MAQIIAKIEKLGNGKNVVYSFENGRDFSDLYNHECYCDVCKKSLQRNEVYVVRLDNGKEIQCGSNCLNKVLPIELDMKSRAIMNNASIDDFGFFMKGKTFIQRDNLLAYLTQTKNVLAKLSYQDFRHEVKDKDVLKNKDLDSLIGAVSAILDYYKSYNGNNEFINNIKHIVENEYIELKHFNIVKYAYKVYEDYVHYLKINDSKGLENETFQIRKIWLEKEYLDRTYSYYGIKTYVYRMYDESNNLIEMITSSTKNFLDYQGQKVKCKVKGKYKSIHGLTTKITHLALLR